MAFWALSLGSGRLSRIIAIAWMVLPAVLWSVEGKIRLDKERQTDRQDKLFNDDIVSREDGRP